MNVLSLFDGLSGGRIALDRMGVKVDKYFASEIDPYAIAVAAHNWPETQHIGSVVDVNPDDLPKIDLLVGGSPCQGFSFAGRRMGSATKEGLDVLTLEHYLRLKKEGFEFDGQSYLFWEYMRILHALREKNPDIKFMLENVVMTKKWEQMFNDAVGVQPIRINSNLVSAQVRKRLYWTNIRVDGQPADKGILLKDILEPTVPQNHYISESKYAFIERNGVNIKLNKQKSTCLSASFWKQGKQECINLISDREHDLEKIEDLSHTDVYRKFTPLECERLQTVPDNYTHTPYGKRMMSDSQRYKMIGNGWTIDVICHLLKNYKEPIAIEPESILF